MRRFSAGRLILVAMLWGYGLLATPQVFNDGSVISSDSIHQDVDPAQNRITLNGSITVDGDREFQFSQNGTVYIGSAAGSGAVTVAPATGKPGHLVFNVASGKRIDVHVWNDLNFVGSATGSEPMHLSFRGKGQVNFRLPCGKTVSFGSSGSNGTHVRILMDQERDDMATPMVLFSSWSYDVDSVNQVLSQHRFVKVGQDSSLSFVSQHASGLPEAHVLYGYGSLAFDPSNSGKGRFILEIAKGVNDGDFKDGAVNIYGSLVTGSGPTGGALEVLNKDLRTAVSPKYRAGIQASMRIMHDVAKAEDAAWETHKLDPAHRRGLVVINRNHSLPRFANNYDQAATAGASQWFAANTYQTGFVLGNNGMLEIDHNCFLDYIAGAKQVAITDAVHVASLATQAGGTHHASRVKKHNPAALIVDGNAFTYVNASDDGVQYASSEIAQIVMRGHAGIMLRSGASDQTGDVVATTMNSDGLEKTDGSGSYVACVIGKGLYDGNHVPVMDGSVVSAHHAAGEGHHVLDVEGKLKISAHDGHANEQRDGYVRIPSVLLDHAGNEMMFTGGELAAAGKRPLSMASNKFYHRYNASSCLLNDAVELHDVRFIHDDVSRDVSMLPRASGDAAPLIVGGELPSLKVAKALADTPGIMITDYTGSPLYLYNSTIECHESLVAAGVRFVVREKDLAAGQTYGAGDNTSKLVFYNRGDAYDMDKSGHGRVLQLGSSANVMADGVSSDVFSIGGVIPQSNLRDAFIDVYRQKKSTDAAIGSQKNTIKLRVESAYEEGVATHEKALHVLSLSHRSQVGLGWAAGQYDADAGSALDVKVDVDARYKPWQLTDTILASLRSNDPENTQGHRFSPYTQGVGELEFTGDDIYLTAGGRYNASGVREPVNNDLGPRSVADSGGIIFVNFGGKLSATGNSDVLLNTVIARRVAQDPYASGVISLPSDQLIMQKNGKISSYGYHSTLNPNPSVSGLSDVNTVTINAAHVPQPEDFAPVKGGLLKRGFGDIGSGLYATRGTASVTAPVAKPATGMMELKTGDYLDQVQVAAATPARALHISVSGDDKGFARVREFVSVPSDPPVLGEGSHAALFLDGGARIGLGSRRWNEHSVKAWNQLGKDKVNIYAHGNAVVDLNDDILITDKLPLIATTEFGRTDTHRLTFYSSVPREIRVPAHGVLDLSSFGASVGYQAYGKQIAFAGKVRLVLEPGAKIRFPSIAQDDEKNRGPVLYFTDDACLVFEGNDDRDEGRWVDGLTGSDKVRNKILGCGHIWLNKNARMEVMDTALLGVESDKETPHTDVTVSIRRKALFLLGDGNKAGGAFQVGNIVDGGGDGSNAAGATGAVPTAVSFTLAVNGPQAEMHLDREAFFGLGVGIVNKAGNPNGTGLNTNTAWRVQSLHNVKNVKMQLLKGIISHNQIFDGDDDGASVFALGALDYNATDTSSWVSGGTYTLEFGAFDESFVRGGGNVVYFGTGFAHTAPKELAIKATHTDVTLDYSVDSGRYDLLAPDLQMRAVTDIAGATIAASAESYVFTSEAVKDATSQMLAHMSFYNMLTMPDYVQTDQKVVSIGLDQFKVKGAYRNYNTHKRLFINDARDIFGNRADPKEGLEVGYLDGIGRDADGNPEAYGVA